MEVTFKCNHCLKTIEADSEISGDRAACPACGEIVLVPYPGIVQGTEINGFKVIDKIGSGGMGEVFKANQVAMDRIVALKVLPPALTNDQKTVDRFLHEVRMAAKLEHPNIVTAFDAGQVKDIFYLAMSFVEGQDLEQIFKNNGAFSVPEGLRIARDVASALDYAWSKYQILHRDIKPANIMLDEYNNVKLMDMGIAKSIKEDSSLTMQGSLVGTPYYMSPEQSTASSEIDVRSDLYALGGTLYYLLTAKKPFEGPNAMAIVAKRISEMPPEPCSIRSDLPLEVSNLIMKAMAKEPSERHKNCQEFIDEVDAILRGESTIIAPLSSSTEFNPGASRITKRPSNDELIPELMEADDEISLKDTQSGHTQNTLKPLTPPTINKPELKEESVEDKDNSPTPPKLTKPEVGVAYQHKDYEKLEGGSKASSVKGMKEGMFGAAMVGVLTGVLILAIIIWLVVGMMNKSKQAEIDLIQKQIEQDQVAKDVTDNLLDLSNTDISEDSELNQQLKILTQTYKQGTIDEAAYKKALEKIKVKAKTPEFKNEVDEIIADLNKNKGVEISQRLVSTKQYAPAAYFLDDYLSATPEDQGKYASRLSKLDSKSKSSQTQWRNRNSFFRALMKGDRARVKEFMDTNRSKPEILGFSRDIMQQIRPKNPSDGSKNNPPILRILKEIESGKIKPGSSQLSQYPESVQVSLNGLALEILLSTKWKVESGPVKFNDAEIEFNNGGMYIKFKGSSKRKKASFFVIGTCLYTSFSSSFSKYSEITLENPSLKLQVSGEQSLTLRKL